MKIVGISLVKDEERFVALALTNALALCDWIDVIDNASRDATPRILRRLKTAFPGRISVRRQPDLLRTHEAVRRYVGTNTWLFGVDGDEVYDPVGLRQLRERILSGEFAGDWMVRAHFCHVCALQNGTARGWLAPPSHDPSKLYNMRLVEAWPSDPARPLFHGEGLRLRDGMTYFERHRALNRELSWEASPFRCLHMRFVPRSIVDPSDVNRLARPRLNPNDLTFLARTRQGVNERLEYRRGDEVTVSTAPFGLEAR